MASHTATDRVAGPFITRLIGRRRARIVMLMLRTTVVVAVIGCSRTTATCDTPTIRGVTGRRDTKRPVCFYPKVWEILKEDNVFVFKMSKESYEMIPIFFDA